jgi:hypothetical protein
MEQLYVGGVMEQDDIKNLAIQCSCKFPTHIARFTLDASVKSELPELRIEIILNPNLSFWGRLRAAIWYIINPTKTRYCHYDDIIVEHSDVIRIHRQSQMYLAWHKLRFLRLAQNIKDKH